MLDANVLVLNRLWQAVNICTARRAFSLLYTGQAQVIDVEEGKFSAFNFEDWKDLSTSFEKYEEVIHTISFSIRIPKVILLLLYDKLPCSSIKFNRKNIYQRDKNICQYCGKKFDLMNLNIDHVIPKVLGGKSVWTNVVCSCTNCNLHKGGRTPQQAGMKLILAPKEPRWQYLVHFNIKTMHHESWKHFIDTAYWNTELESDEDK